MFRVSMSWGTQTQTCFFLQCPQLTKQQLSQQFARFRQWEPFLKPTCLRIAWSPHLILLILTPGTVSLVSLRLFISMTTTIMKASLSSLMDHYASPSSWALCTPETLSVHAAQR